MIGESSKTNALLQLIVTGSSTIQVGSDRANNDELDKAEWRLDLVLGLGLVLQMRMATPEDV